MDNNCATVGLSIIIPIYNGEKYLAALLDSILVQDYLDWECLCIDDGGQDGSLAILKAYAQNDSRFKILSKPNGGTGDSRNEGLSRAQGEFILFADQDDLFHPQAFRYAVKGIQEASCDIVTFNHAKFRKEWKPRAIEATTLPLHYWGVANKLPFPANVHSDILVWRHIFRREAIKDVRFPKLSGGEDHVFMSALLFTACTWASLDLTLYGNRQNEASCSRMISLRYIEAGFEAIYLTYQLAQEKTNNLSAWKERSLKDTFWFVLSIVLMHGCESQAHLYFSCLKRCLEKGVRLRILDLKICNSYTLFLNLVIAENLDALKALALFGGLFRYLRSKI